MEAGCDEAVDVWVAKSFAETSFSKHYINLVRSRLTYMHHHRTHTKYMVLYKSFVISTTQSLIIIIIIIICHEKTPGGTKKYRNYNICLVVNHSLASYHQ